MPAADRRAARRVTRRHTSLTTDTAAGLSVEPSPSCSAAEAAARSAELRCNGVSVHQRTREQATNAPDHGGDQRCRESARLLEPRARVGVEQRRPKLGVSAQKQLRSDAAQVKAGDELLERLPAGVDALHIHSLVGRQPRQRGRLEASPLGVDYHMRAAQLRRVQLADARQLLEVRRVGACGNDASAVHPDGGAQRAPVPRITDMQACGSA